MKTRGFTLIELLVVIAIIGLLSSVVLASLNVARERGQNAKRMQDMREIGKALELYALENNGNYPNLSWAYGCNASSWNNLQTALAPHISTLPADPAQDCTATRDYYVVTTLTDYKVIIHVPPNTSTASQSIWDPTRDNGSNAAVLDGNSPWAWAIYTPGGASW